MNTHKIAEKIEPMIGRPYMYRARLVRVQGYGIPGDQVRIKTNKNTISFPVEKLDAELDQFLPVEDEGSQALMSQRESTEKQALAIFQQDAGRMNSMEDTIMSNIEKLQGEDGQKYLEQAKAVNDNVKTLLDMTKTKLKMHQEIRKSQKMS